MTFELPISEAEAAKVAAHAQAFRREIRGGAWRGPTAGRVDDALQVNLAILPAELAPAFADYCAANPRACPLIARSEPGARALPALGRDVDVVRDAPGYRLFHDGGRGERVDDLEAHWRGDLTTFALGCSFTFERALERAGIEMRHVSRGRNVPMYVTNRQTAAVGPFEGPMVVSMRPLRPEDTARAAEICARFPHAHGAPVHVGDPAALGIDDVARPDFGDAPELAPGEICVFWACGVTPQTAIMAARPDFAATHEPGCMLVTDLHGGDPDLIARTVAAMDDDETKHR